MCEVIISILFVLLNLNNILLFFLFLEKRKKHQVYYQVLH